MIIIGSQHVSRARQSFIVKGNVTLVIGKHKHSYYMYLKHFRLTLPCSHIFSMHKGCPTKALCGSNTQKAHSIYRDVTDSRHG